MFKTLFKFATSGASAAGLNLVVFWTAQNIFGVHYSLAAFIASVISASYHFAMQKLWVFASKETDVIKSEGVLFLLASIINILLNQVFLFVLISIMFIPSFVAQVISLGTLACINFFLYEKIIFKRKTSFSKKIHNTINTVFQNHE